jgi:hypothetical protein
MRNFKILTLLIALSAFYGCNQSGNKSISNDTEKEVIAPSEKETSASMEKEVASAVEDLNNAIIDPEESVLDSLVADEITYGHSSGLVQNKEEFIDDLVNGNFDFTSINISDQTIHIVDETAVVRQIFSAEATNSGTPVEVKIGNVLVYVKQNSQWKLLARQAFRL